MKSASTLGWISLMTQGKKRYIGFLLAVQALLGSTGVIMALFLREMIDGAVAGRQDCFLRYSMFLIGLVLCQIALRAALRFLDEFTKSSLENRLKKQLFDALLKKDFASVARIHSGEWMNRLTSDTVVVAEGLTQIVPGIAGMLVKLVGALGALLLLEPRFAYLILPGGALLVLLTYLFRKRLKQLHKAIQEKDGDLRVFLQERLSSMMIVRAFAQEEAALKGAGEKMQLHKAARMRRNHFSNLCNMGFGLAMNGAYVFGAVYCGYGILTQTMSYGTLTAVLQLITQVQSPFANITGYLPKYYAMLASAERLMEAETYREDGVKSRSEAEIMDFYRKQFVGMGMRNASFAYLPPVRRPEGEASMPVILRHFNMDIEKGEYVAFTGLSGCGKSTVLKLFMSLYELDEGECYLKAEGRVSALPTNAADSGERSGNCAPGNGKVLPLDASWRGLFAYVPQGNQLLSGTIREILAFGNQEKMKQEEQLREALRIACAEEFVIKLEQGMDTVLGERGCGLSEGQMQRIAIARAVFSGHPILMLDEATSSLDEETERALLENLRSMTDKTVLIVTHRPAVLEICDKRVEM